jgi:LuxR family maltose regulon positive regulatory protein
LGNGELKLDGDIPYLHEKEYLMLARFLLANGQFDEAAILAQRLLERAEAGGRISRMIEILIVQALLFQARSDPIQSMRALERTLTLAQPGGFVRVFVDEGPPMASLLYQALSREIAPDYVQRLLAAFPVEEPDQIRPAQTQSDEAEWIEPLSEREIEVLRLVAEGLSRQEIASQLVLSLNTVKTHARNIYSKLGVHNQMQAVGKARALGLLEYE